MNEKNNIDELLNKKNDNDSNDSQIEEKELSDDTNDLKKRMQKVINASKKLDNDLLNDASPESKKALLKEKLSKARENEEMYEEEVNDEREHDNIESDDLDELVKAKKAKYLAEKEAKEAQVNEEEVIEDEEDDLEALVRAKKAKYLAEKEAKEKALEENKDIENEELESNSEDIKEEQLEVKEEPVKSKKHLGKKVLDYVIKTMNGMAYGLFATLIIGTIISTLGQYVFKYDPSVVSTELSAGLILYYLGTKLLMPLTGMGIGIGIAYSLGYKDIKLISMAAVGGIASYMCYSSSAGNFVSSFGFKVGDPLTIYLVVIITSIVMEQIFRKKTPVDILIVPLFTTLLGAALTLLISKYTVYLTAAIGEFIGVATEYQPILMGIIIAGIMGMALTAPISSAAIAATVFTTLNIENNPYVAIAAGAALIGCSTQMVGFAIHSRKDNNIGSVLAIAFGTSMLQFKNILKKPIIWLPTIIVSVILGPIATTLIGLKCAGGAFGGMGTSGLVGQIGTFIQMGGGLNVWLIVIGFEILLPAVLVFLLDLLFRKLGWIKPGDFKL